MPGTSVLSKRRCGGVRGSGFSEMDIVFLSQAAPPAAPPSAGPPPADQPSARRNPAVVGSSDEALCRTRTGDPFLTIVAPTTLGSPMSTGVSDNCRGWPQAAPALTGSV